MYDGTEVAIKVGGLGELALRSMKIMKPKRIRKLGLFANYPVVRRVGMKIFPPKMGSQLELRIEFPIVSCFHMTKLNMAMLNMAIPIVSHISIVEQLNIAMCWQSFQIASSLHDRNDMTGASRARGSGLRRRSSGRGWSICPFSGEYHRIVLLHHNMT